MDCVFQIGEISKFFNIPASTLRFWEESGVLIPEKNPENQYRTYTVSDLMTISDILFYKSLGLPLKQIRDMEQMGIPAHQDICQQQMEILRQQQSALEHLGLSITYQQKEQEHYQNALWENYAGKYVVCLMKEEIIPGFPVEWNLLQSSCASGSFHL